MKTWDELNFWNTGEWQAIQERLDDLDDSEREQGGRGYNPARQDIFAALDKVSPQQVKVAIFGQDPYPESKYATGVAFSIPDGYRSYPPTLENIFKEYGDDLHLSRPTSGDLTSWCTQGVLLWNVYPTCTTGIPASHRWVEWEDLNREIVEYLKSTGTVFVFLGAEARKYEKYVQPTVQDGKTQSLATPTVIATSHPSPLGVLKGKNPFFGSRIFSRINAALVEGGEQPIDWKLKGSRTIEKK